MSAYGEFFNHYSHVAEGYWERRSFLGAWRRLYGSDRRWTPPLYPALNRALTPGKSAYIDRTNPARIYLEALFRQRRSEGAQGGQFTMSMEEPVAAGVLLADPRRRDRTAYLALLHCANDEESLDRLISTASEQAGSRGFSGLIGPVALSPHLGSGVLLDHYHQSPPLHTPYNPPYLPELIANALEPGAESRLFHVACGADAPARLAHDDLLQPLEPARLATDLLPLLQAACAVNGGFPPPDGVEAAFMLEWLGIFPLSGWLASVEGQPVGFALLQPDLSAALRLARGGRNPLWRAWLAWRGQRGARTGRLLFGSVLPEQRGRGIGRKLWQAALGSAHAAGWQEMTIGPLPPGSAGAAFLNAMGAHPRQRYRLYGTDAG